jgi:uncharacterized protein (DUF4415 family)
MKSDSLPKDFPDNPEAWARLVAEAPGEDRDPTAEEQAIFAKGFTSNSLDEFKTKLAARRKTRGPNKLPVKERVTLRLSRDVIERFRAGGAGWQTRVDRVLKDWLKTQQSA